MYAKIAIPSNIERSDRTGNHFPRRIKVQMLDLEKNRITHSCPMPLLHPCLFLYVRWYSLLGIVAIIGPVAVRPRIVPLQREISKVGLTNSQ